MNRRFARSRAVIIACALAVPAAAPCAERHAITFDDLIALGRIGSFEISPDGTRLVFEATWFDKEDNGSNTDIYLTDLRGGEAWRFARGDADDHSPCWSPDGKYIAFVSDREGSPQLWIIPTDGGEARRVTDVPTGVSQPVWSPRGDWIAFNSRVYPECTDMECNGRMLEKWREGAVKARLIDHLLYRHWNHWREGRWSHLFVTDVDGSTLIEINKGRTDVPPISLGGELDYDFSPAGDELCFTLNPDSVVAFSTNNDLYIMELPDGVAVPITSENRANDNNPRYSPDGRYIAYRAQTRPGFEADRYRLMIFDRGTRKISNLTEGFDYSIGIFSWAPDSRNIYFSTDDRGRSSIGRITVPGGDAELVIQGYYDTRLRVAPDGKSLVVARQSATRPIDLYRVNLGRKDALQLTHINDEVLDALRMNGVEEFWFEGAAGAQVHGMLVKPPFFKEGERYPMVVLIHGGPQGFFGDDFHFRWNAQMFAAPGWVVAMINPRGSTGYGQEFTDEISGDWGGKVYTDLMNGIDHIVEHYPFVDGERIGAAGASYGGYMINWIEGHSDRFRCLVSHAGVFNLESMYGATEELWFPEWDFGGTPWDNPGNYERFSPHRHVGRFKTPCLVVHGENDFRVPYTQGLEFFTALQRMGVPSKLLFFPDEDHFVRKPQNAELWWKTLHEWFAEWFE